MLPVIWPIILLAMRTGLVVTLVSIVLFGCANAQTPDDGAPAAGGSETVVIADGRAAAEGTDLSAWSSPAMPQAFAVARAHWQAQDSGYEEETRVMAVAEGAFSEPGASQEAVLYLMSLWPRCCPRMGIAVIEDGALVRNVAFEAPAQGLAVVPDLDGDGRDELAVTGSFGMGGENSTSVTLVSLADSGLRTWGGAMIQYDACAAMQEGGMAVRITAIPGPEFTIEQFALASCETGEYQPGGPPEPFEFPAPGEEMSVELPIR
ncbi:MAG TPA: hypothetical protein VM737_01590 [Gemmatimonadota bacterium]|nr:hypothetical protein [Gemmatimonadota bacterium]